MKRLLIPALALALTTGLVACKDDAAGDESDEAKKSKAADPHASPPAQVYEPPPPAIVAPEADPGEAPPAAPEGAGAEVPKTYEGKRLAWAERLLTKHVKTWGLAEPKAGWAIAHAIHALGPDLEVRGQDAVDTLMSLAFLKEITGKKVPYFKAEEEGVVVEPHQDLILRVLLESGMPWDRPFVVEGETFTLGDFYENTIWAYHYPRLGLGPHAWTLLAMHSAYASGHANGEVNNHQGEVFTAGHLADRALRNLLGDSAFLKEVQAGRKALIKRKQGIYGYACGGFHAIESVAVWADHPDMGPEFKQRLFDLVSLTEFRLRAEAKLYREVRPRTPVRLQYRIDLQEVKFFGHYLETMATVRDAGIAVTEDDIVFARQRLLDALVRVQQGGHFGKMARYAQHEHQVYLDLIGDSAHALKALKRWKGKWPDGVE